MANSPKNRNVVLCVLFTVITCGIYGLYWWAKVTTETNVYSKYKTADGLLAFIWLILTGGTYLIYWNYMMGKKVAEMDGEGSVLDPLFFFILFPVNVVLAQQAINRKVGA